MIRKLFKYGYCCDEMFIQTMLVNSKDGFKNYLGIYTEVENQQNLRAIDWKRGNPYTYSIDDYEELEKPGNCSVEKLIQTQISINHC